MCFLGMGAPAGAEEIRGYLYRIFRDRHIIPAPALVRIPLAYMISRRVWRRSLSKYESIGGRSPYTEQTLAQAEAISAQLSSCDTPIPVVAATRYSSPSIPQAVGESLVVVA